MNIKTRMGLFSLTISTCWALNYWVILLRVQMREIKEGSSLDRGSWHGDSYALFLVLSPAGSGTRHTTSSCHTSFQPLLKWRYQNILPTQGSSQHCGCLLWVLRDLQMQGAAELPSELGTSTNQTLQHNHSWALCRKRRRGIGDRLGFIQIGANVISRTVSNKIKTILSGL